MSRLICLGAQKNSLIENVLLSTHKSTYKSTSSQNTFVVDSEKIIKPLPYRDTFDAFAKKSRPRSGRAA